MWASSITLNTHVYERMHAVKDVWSFLVLLLTSSSINWRSVADTNNNTYLQSTVSVSCELRVNNQPVDSGVGFDAANVRNTMIQMIPYGRGYPLAFPIVPTAPSGGVVVYVTAAGATG
jgi:hypothetical protein